MLGDLAESLLKRDASVKDSSHLVPAFGGILDIIDCLLISMPVAYYFLLFFKLV
jgi:phosphatidate cytidylyltransferase